MRQARYRIISDTEARIIIEDLGPWDYYPTVTNDAEGVVETLHRQGKLPAGKTLLCQDSEGIWDELCHDGEGRFTKFAPLSKKAIGYPYSIRDRRT